MIGPLKIAFDPHIFCLQRYGGASRYFAELVGQLSELPDTIATALAFVHINQHLSGSGNYRVVGRAFSGLPEFLRPGLARANAYLAGHWINRNPVDVLHETYYSMRPVSRSFSGPVVITVLDMIHERFPSLHSRFLPVTERKRAAVARADHVICISESTRRDLIEILGVKPEKTSVVHLGSTLRAPGAAGTDTGPAADGKPYVLFVGKRGGYKNFRSLLLAFGRSESLRNSHRLVCFGDVPLLPEERAEARHLGMPSGHLLHETGGDARLGVLYQHASLLAYPSLYEGFGIPPLEAMSLGCPVACSNTSSLPEVVGDAAEQFDPEDPADIARALEAVLGSTARSQELRRKGFERARMFSWSTCAIRTRRVYSSLVRGGAG